MALDLTPLAAADPIEVETLLDAAFGTDRHQRTAYRLREGARTIPRLSFAAWEEGRLVGTLQSWPVALQAATGIDELVMVGPVAVAPDRQNSGIGRALMKALLQEATDDDALMMIGDPEYYERFGFSAAATGGWRIDGPYEQRRLLGRLRRDVAREGMLASLCYPHASLCHPRGTSVTGGQSEDPGGTRRQRLTVSPSGFPLSRE